MVNVRLKIGDKVRFRDDAGELLERKIIYVTNDGHVRVSLHGCGRLVPCGRIDTAYIDGKWRDVVTL